MARQVNPSLRRVMIGHDEARLIYGHWLKEPIDQIATLDDLDGHHRLNHISHRITIQTLHEACMTAFEHEHPGMVDAVTESRVWRLRYPYDRPTNPPDPLEVLRANALDEYGELYTDEVPTL